MTMEQLAWLLCGGACSLLLLGINVFLSRILDELAGIRKWRGGVVAAVNELQGRCAAHHKTSPEIRHILTSD